MCVCVYVGVCVVVCVLPGRQGSLLAESTRFGGRKMVQGSVCVCVCVCVCMCVCVIVRLHNQWGVFLFVVVVLLLLFFWGVALHFCFVDRRLSTRFDLSCWYISLFMVLALVFV